MSTGQICDAVWAALAALLVAAVVLSVLPGTGVARVSDLVRRAQSSPVLFVAVLLGWMWVGWHFFAR